jgi:hypothetical protein
MMVVNDMTIKKVKYIGIGFLLALLLLLFVLFLVPSLSVDLINSQCKTVGCEFDSAIEIASSIGRLDLVSLLLGIFGISIGFFIFSFFALKEHAAMIAETTARKVAADVVGKRMDWLESVHYASRSLSSTKVSQSEVDIEALVNGSGDIDENL